MNLVNAAMYIAMEAHRGEVNKHDGELYIHHPHRIAMTLAADGYSDIYIALAWLHDVVEDTEWTLQNVSHALIQFVEGEQDRNLSDQLVEALDAMTHRDNEPNSDYYHRIRRNVVARAVGWHDKVRENFGRNHLIENDTNKQLRLAKKYSLAVNILDGPGPVA